MFENENIVTLFTL